MEQPNSLLNHQHHGVLRLPPGFRFHPTDEELVVQYLRRKALCCPLPPAGIGEINLSKCDPWDLLGGCEEERYFFSLREAKYPNGTRSNRTASSGYWKATGRDKAVVSSRCNQVVVGTKKVLVFHRGKPPAGSRTDWIMHEYRLAGAFADSCPQRKDSSDSQMVLNRDWVLCRIFKKKRAIRTDAEVDEDHEQVPRRSRAIDFTGRRGRSRRPSSSLNSSCVTEAADSSNSGEEATSACTSSPP